MLDKINDNGSLLIDYTYNAIGQMTRQVEGSNTMNVSCNAYGLVKDVRDGSGVLMEEFLYDDQGNRIIKKAWPGRRPKWGINRVVRKKQLLKFIPNELHCLVHFIITLAQTN